MIINMASITALTRLFNNIAINIPRKIDVKLISTTNSLAYLRQSTNPKYKQKFFTRGNRDKLRVEVPWFPKSPPNQREIIDTTEEDDKKIADITNEINNQISSQSFGRLFAVIHVCGKQYKVTESDIIVIHGYWPPTAGDKIKFEKVLLVGSADFTLIGRPLLDNSLVNVDATVVEKTLSHTKTHFIMRKRKQFRRIHFERSQLTIVRINSINLKRKINDVEEMEEPNSIYI